jgi:cell division septum initiation protein DivIVA
MQIFNLKKRYFKRDLAQTQAKIWAMELARYITLYDRERTRQQIDQVSDVLNRLKPNPDAHKDDIEKLEEQLKGFKRTIDEIDEILDGQKPSPDYPQGTRGLNQSLEAQVEKREHIKNFIKHYC